MSSGAGLVVHPATDLTYASFAIEGFAQHFGASAIHYSTEGFPTGFAGGRTLACYLADDPTARTFLVFTDQTTIHQAGHAWARVYGMVNLAPDAAALGVLPLGPTFGIKLTSSALTRRHFVHMWEWAVRRTASPALKRRIELASERTRSLSGHQRKRAPISAYAPHVSDPNYIFFTAWPWSKHSDVNPPRIRFIEACRRAPGLDFEGGFAPRRRDDVPEVRGYTAPGRYALADYLEKIGRSAAVFNNPAVHGCLGWKLGEFLALGKAVISLPIDRDRVLPEPLEHGVHVHYVDASSASLDDALARIRTDDDYRRTLETNARSWYERNLAPARLATRVLDALAR
jgi:hypothetical protein